jgi:hypothetical protein
MLRSHAKKIRNLSGTPNKETKDKDKDVEQMRRESESESNGEPEYPF